MFRSLERICPPSLSLVLCLLGTSVAFLLATLFLLPSPLLLEASPALDQVTVESHSRIPGAQTAYEVSFVTSEGMDGLTDRIVMEIHEDIGVPAQIRPSAVTVTYSEGGSIVHGHVEDIHLSGQSDPGEFTTVSLAPHIDDNGSAADIPAGTAVTVTHYRLVTYPANQLVAVLVSEIDPEMSNHRPQVGQWSVVYGCFWPAE